jgi:hypothetical protein
MEHLFDLVERGQAARVGITNSPVDCVKCFLVFFVSRGAV